VQLDAVACYRSSADIIRSVLTVGLSDDVHPVVVSYLDDLGNWLGASPRSMEMVRAAVCIHGCATLRRIGLMVGIKPVDTARLLADCSGGVAWLTWAAALLECYPHDEVAWFQQEVGRMVSLKSRAVPHLRELSAALKMTAPRLGTISFPEHYARICGAMRQALFEKTELCPARVAEPPLLADVHELLVTVAECFKEQRAVAVRGQQSIGWLAATLSWIYGEAVEVLSAAKVVVAAEMRAPQKDLPPLILVELSEDESAVLTLEYVMEKDTLVSTLLTGQARKETLLSFGPKRSRADEYFTNWLNCTCPVGSYELGPLSTAASQFTCGLLRTIHVTNEGGGPASLRAEVQGAGKQLVNILKLPGAYSDVRRVGDFFRVEDGRPEDTTSARSSARSSATSQLQLILRSEQEGDEEKVTEGGSVTALAFLANVPSLREVYGRLIREMMKVGIKGQNECFCVVPGSGPEAYLPSAHEPHCGTYQAASLAVELVAACICSLFIEGPTSPRLTMFHASPLRWAISKAIEQSVLAGSALISGSDLMKSVLVIAGYSGDYGYGPLITSCNGQALVLAAVNELTLSPHSVGRVLALPGAVIHRGQYYDRVVVGHCRRQGGDVLRGPKAAAGMKRKKPHDSNEKSSSDDTSQPFTVDPSCEGAADKIEIVVRETLTDLELLVRSRQSDGTIKEHDIWHCVTAALTANVLGDCSHKEQRGYTAQPGEGITLVGTSTNLSRGVLDSGLTIATVGKAVDRLLACGVNVNMVVRTTGCLGCAVAACKQVGYRYIVS